MRALIRHHQNKSAHLEEALRRYATADGTVVLIDYDLPHPAYDNWVELAREENAALIIYPHGFSTTWVQDLVGDPITADASLVPGPGQAHLLDLYDYPTPVHVIGWPGPHDPIRPRKLERVLFAPHHPLGSGYMQPDCLQANADAFRILLDEPFDLSVRLVGSLEQNGLWHEPGVHYVQGQMDNSLHLADVVVAGGTYAANCLSYGVPVVMYDQDREWRLEDERQAIARYPAGWREHRDFTRYPIDLAPGACEIAAGGFDVSEWIERFMPSFDAEAFVRTVEQIAEEALCRS